MRKIYYTTTAFTLSYLQLLSLYITGCENSIFRHDWHEHQDDKPWMKYSSASTVKLLRVLYWHLSRDISGISLYGIKWHLTANSPLYSTGVNWSSQRYTFYDLSKNINHDQIWKFSLYTPCYLQQNYSLPSKFRNISPLLLQPFAHISPCLQNKRMRIVGEIVKN
jgi:hypothetical protein